MEQKTSFATPCLPPKKRKETLHAYPVKCTRPRSQEQSQQVSQYLVCSTTRPCRVRTTPMASASSGTRKRILATPEPGESNLGGRREPRCNPTQLKVKIFKPILRAFEDSWQGQWRPCHHLALRIDGLIRTAICTAIRTVVHTRSDYNQALERMGRRTPVSV